MSGSAGGRAAQVAGGCAAPRLLTVGHSNLDFADFARELAEARVGQIVDVRRLPGSARYPQFDAEALAAALGERGIGYERIAGLTGRRNVSREVPFEVNAWWQNRSFHNYADHALGEEFAEGLTRLLEIARSVSGGAAEPVKGTSTGAPAAEAPGTALMCSEAVWWRCHRRIIADHLLARGLPVTHLMGPGKLSPAQLSAGARVCADGGDVEVTYPG